METAGMILILVIMSVIGYRIAKKADDFIAAGGFLMEAPQEEDDEQ